MCLYFRFLIYFILHSWILYFGFCTADFSVFVLDFYISIILYFANLLWYICFIFCLCICCGVLPLPPYDNFSINMQTTYETKWVNLHTKYVRIHLHLVRTEIHKILWYRGREYVVVVYLVFKKYRKTNVPEERENIPCGSLRAKHES